MRQIRRLCDVGRHGGSPGITLAETLISLTIAAVLLALLLPTLARTRELGRRSTCQENLRQWGMVFALYAGESRDYKWPPLQASFGTVNRVFDTFSISPRFDSVYPEYVNDLELFSCPSDRDSLSVAAGSRPLREVLQSEPRLAGRSYAYLGWVVDKANRPEAYGNAFSRLGLLHFLLSAETDIDKLLVNAQLAAGLDARLAGASPAWLIPSVLQEVCDLDVNGVAAHPITGEPLGNGKSGTIYRLREGIARFLITDIACASCAKIAASELWIMFDQSVPFDGGTALNHQPSGSNVLYMDGHVAYIRFAHGAWDSELQTWRDGPAVPPVMPSIVRTIGAIGAER